MPCQPQFDHHQWATKHFATASLGDKRRSDRLVKLVGQIVERPAGSLPKITQSWRDVKAAYRLLDAEQVTLQSVTSAHRAALAARPGTQLILSDTCHIDFGKKRKIAGAGPIGPGKSVGFLLHSALAYDAHSREILGVAGQIAHARTGQKQNRKESEKGKEWAESNLWSDLFRLVGPSNEHTHRIHVCDSAADDYQNFFTAIEVLSSDLIVRCGRPHRHVIDENGSKRSVSKAIKDARAIGCYRLKIPRRGGRRARIAEMQVSIIQVQLPQPRFCSPEIKASDRDGFAINIVVAQETHAPRGTTPVRWVLMTSLPVSNLAEAMFVIESYELRWSIEEWHKAIKSGCALQNSQHQDLDRLLPLTGIYSVVAVLLLQLRESSRQQPNRPAKDIVPAHWIELLMTVGNFRRRPQTADQLWRSIAQLGGYLNRRHDGPPGWQSIWSGWQLLHFCLKGYESKPKSKLKCG